MVKMLKDLGVRFAELPASVPQVRRGRGKWFAIGAGGRGRGCLHSRLVRRWGRRFLRKIRELLAGMDWDGDEGD